MRKIDMKNVGKFVGEVGKILVYGASMVLPYAISESALKKLNDLTIGYDTVIKAVMDSSMLSSQKSEVLPVVKPNETKEYYKAIIYVLESNILSSDKVKMIKDLSMHQGG